MTARLREAEEEDLKGIVGCILSSGLFDSNEVGAVEEMFKQRDSAQVWIVAEQDQFIAGVLYAGPLEVTDRSWNLWMLAVHGDHKRTGIGSQLVKRIEERLKCEKQRLLIIETTQKADQVGARALYTKLGYKNVAQVPDYYEDGADKITFMKRL